MKRIGCCAVALLLCTVGVRAGSNAPLADAAQSRDRARVRALVNQRVDVDARQVDGMTALHWAVHHDDTETAELLLRAGATAKTANRYGITPLSLACTNGNGAVVELLLKRGANVRAKDHNGESALDWAINSGNDRIVRLLSLLSASAGIKQLRPRLYSVDSEVIRLFHPFGGKRTTP
jgi:ankyrin repeat protein